MGDYAFRNMTPADWPRVRAIYLEGISTGQATFETSAPDWESWHASHRSDCRLVAEKKGRVQAWAALSPASKRPVYAGVAEVSIYVAQAARGQGLGKALMQQLIHDSEAAGIWSLYCSIFPENQASASLLEGLGFRRVGIRERIARQHGVWRDTLILERRSQVAGI